MYKTNTRCSSGLSRSSIIILPLDVTSTSCVSEKLIWCLGGEKHFKIILRAEPSCRPAEAFSTPFAPAQQASNLTFERISRIVPSSLSLSCSKSAHRPPSEKQLSRTRARRTARLGARTRRGNRRRRRRKAEAGGGGGVEAGEEGAGGAGEAGGRRKIICICMRHPALPSSPAAARAGAEEGGDVEGRKETRTRRQEQPLRPTRVWRTEEVICMAPGDWMMAGGWV